MLRLLAIAPLFLASCIPMSFRPARTLPEGEIEHTIGANGFHVPEPRWDDTIGESSDRRPKMMLPGACYTLRYGASSALDVGFGLASPTALTIDATFQLIRTRRFDLALGPTLVWEFQSNLPAIAAPVLVDLNLDSWSSIVGFGGPVLVAASTAENGRIPLTVFQAGIGIDLRPTSWLSLRPYAGLIGPRIVNDGAGGSIPFFGLGIALGGQRDFR